jgi:hypothetical protein
MEIVSQDESTLVLRSGSRTTTIDKRRRVVASGGKILARFDAIKSVDITRQGGDEGDWQSEQWYVSLNLGWFSSISIGCTADQTEASIAGARLSTYTGKKVRAL